MEKECISINHICEIDKCQETGSLALYTEGNIDTMEWVVAYQCSKLDIDMQWRKSRSPKCKY